ncbi:MAG: hypothetical protein A2046_08965 [Bacteroidetes bacterium GWA2_30_7]|nr:MAG: hypothetical protein A2046_08965 [Bacteroidetes bacterium GWA2_30_7]
MKYFVLTLMFVALSGFLFSQDIIRKFDGTEIKCKIIEASKSEVKYKTDDSSEPKSIFSEDIKEIQFKDGTIKTYTKKIVEHELKKHMFSVDLMQFFGQKTLYLSYQFQASKKLAIHVPFSYKNIFKRQKTFIGGSVDFRYILNNSEPSKIYIGPLDLGIGNVDYFVGPSFQVTSFYNATTFYYIKGTAGVSMQQLWGLNASLFVGFGPGYDFSNSLTDFDWTVNITFGYRFNKRIVKE